MSRFSSVSQVGCCVGGRGVHLGKRISSQRDDDLLVIFESSVVKWHALNPLPQGPSPFALKDAGLTNLAVALRCQPSAFTFAAVKQFHEEQPLRKNPRQNFG
jgi:hypothetical protein